MAFMASVSRVLSSSTTSESTKSSRFHAVFWLAIFGYFFAGKSNGMIGGPERGGYAIERGHRSDLQPAVLIAQDFQFHGCPNIERIDIGMDPHVVIIDLSVDGDHLFQYLVKWHK